MEGKNSSANSVHMVEPWPSCVLAEGNCIGFDLVSLMGPEANRVLMEYIWNSNDGSRLTIQKSKQGLTVQVTDEVHRSNGDEVVGFEQFRSLKQHLDSLSSTDD